MWWMPPPGTHWSIKWSWLCPPGTAARNGWHRAYQEAAFPYQTTEILLCHSLLLGLEVSGDRSSLSHMAGRAWGPEEGSGPVPRELQDYVWKSDWGFQVAPSLVVPSTGTGAELLRRREALLARGEGHQQGHGFLPAFSEA